MIETVKWSINNSCNMRCPFCIVEDVKTPTLSFEENCRVLDKMYSDGIENIDFFGKEPLLDETIFRLMNYCESKGYEFAYFMITNGKNLLKYADKLLNSPLMWITVSYDFLSTRSFNIDLNTLKVFKDEKYIELSIDVQNDTDKILEKLKTIDFSEYGVTSLYFKPIMPYGSLSDNVRETSESSYMEFCEEVLKIEGLPRVTFSVPFEYPKMTREVIGKYNYSTDEKCFAGKGWIYLSSDAKVYGCGVHCSSNKNTELSCDYLTTSIEDIEKMYIDNKRRLCM